MPSAAEAESDEERVSLLHQAEAKLLEDMPVMPVIFLQDYYLINDDVLSGEETNIIGFRDFRGLKMSNYMNIKEQILEEEEAAAEVTLVE